MHYETCASLGSAQFIDAVQTGLRQVSRVCIALQNFLENTYADFMDGVEVKN